MSTAQLSPGTVVDGKFTVSEAARTRAGAWSYTATDPQGQSVILTSYDAACFPSNLVLERSLRELRQLQSLSSPRVASVIACGKLPQGGIYEVNSPLPSQRLDQMLDNGPLAAPEAAALIAQVGEGLLEGQKCGVIHRNLGPRVVFVGAEGAVVTGFAVGEPQGGKSFGPLDTIAPEQIQGKVVDQRTLIYNLAALMHMLLNGSPLYPGDPAEQLAAHLSSDPPPETHARLGRALGKDPRMRPMMLKQFIAELRAIGGGVARAPIAPSARGPKAPPLPGEPTSSGPGGGPSSRGWTMFTKAEDDAPASPSAAKAPQAGVPVAGKPKTRGWTMFMEAADDQPAAKTQAEPPKPSTRGWTMFMEDDEGGEAKPAEPVAQAAAPAEDTVKPKTRGWTMVMEAGDSDEAKAQQAAPPAEPEPAAAVAPPSVGGTEAKPKTRGWTMFMKAEDSDEAKAAKAQAPAVAPPTAKPPVAKPPVAKPPVAAPSVSPPAAKPPVEAPSVSPPAAAPAAKAPSVSPPATAPAAKAPAVASAGTPPGKSRGWTMFMEPAKDKAPAAEAPAAEAPAAEAPAAEAPAAEAPAAEAPVEAVADGSAPAPEPVEAAPIEAALADAGRAGPGKPGKGKGKKRGWTMFMDKPISDAKGDELGDVVPAGESDNKGWTVFTEGEQAQPAPPDASADVAAASEAAPPESPGMPEPGAEPPISEVASPPAEQPVPRAKTLVATAVPSTPAAAPPASQPVAAQPVAQPAAPASARGGTMLAPPGSGAAAANPPPGGGPLATPGPTTGPHSGPIAPVEAAAVAPAKKSSPAVFIAVGVVAEAFKLTVGC